MIVKNVPSSWLQTDGRRLDCGPYMSGALEARIILGNLKALKAPLHTLTLGGPGGIFHAGRIKRQWVDDERYGVRFLSSSDILHADLSRLALISNRAVSENPKLLISPGWTLITRSGTVGRMAYSRQDMAGTACSEDVLRVVPDPGKIPPGYLYAFLSSKFGVPMIVSGTYGAIIQHIEPEHISELPVPRLSKAVEDRSNQLITEMGALLSAYQNGIAAATRLLFESVGLKDITASEWHEMGRDLGFVENSPKVDSLRALNFNPRLKTIISRLQSGPHRSLESLCVPDSLHRGNRFKRIDAAREFAVQLVGQRELFWLQPEGRWIAKSAVGDDVIVEPGTILIAARGTFGESELYCRAEFIWDAAAGMAYSEDLLRVIADRNVVHPGCLFAFMRSETAFRILRSISTGTKLQDHHRRMLRQIPVPYPSSKVRDQIGKMVVEAFDCRHKAMRHEKEARALVESAIEGLH